MNVDIDKIKSDYLLYNNIWKVGVVNGISGQKVHYILNKNGVDTSNKNKWTEHEIIELTNIYNSDFKFGDDCLDDFCKKYKRSKANVCRKARLLGLKTNNKRKYNEVLKKKLSERAKNQIKKFGHPKGFSNKTHCDDAKLIMSKASKEMWKNPNSYVNSDEYRQIISNRSSKMMEERLNSNTGNIYSKSKKGTVEIGGRKVFFRSGWEANVCAYFQYLKDNGHIKDWEYEVKTFWFEKIKRGVRSYKPDFLITENNGYQYFEEVKGWMDDKSKTKIKRMAKYYPNVDLRILDAKRYKEISKIKGLIPNWGLLDK